MTPNLTITRIKLPLANAYLVQGERSILVDTGAPGDADRILSALRQANVRPTDLALILLTHGHGDHVGAANELAALSGAPVALHRADDAMARAGRNVLGTLNGMEARMIAPFVDKPFPPMAASLFIDAPLDLRTYGVTGEVIATHGHTAGSLFRGRFCATGGQHGCRAGATSAAAAGRARRAAGGGCGAGVVEGYRYHIVMMRSCCWRSFSRFGRSAARTAPSTITP